MVVVVFILVIVILFVVNVVEVMVAVLAVGVVVVVVEIHITGHDTLPKPLKKYDKTSLQFFFTRPPSGVGYAAKISSKLNIEFKTYKFTKISCQNKIFELFM